MITLLRIVTCSAGVYPASGSVIWEFEMIYTYCTTKINQRSPIYIYNVGSWTVITEPVTALIAVTKEQWDSLSPKVFKLAAQRYSAFQVCHQSLVISSAPPLSYHLWPRVINCIRTVRRHNKHFRAYNEYFHTEFVTINYNTSERDVLLPRNNAFAILHSKMPAPVQIYRIRMSPV